MAVKPTVASQPRRVLSPAAACALIRQIHRWLSIVFTATVIANFVTMAFGPPPPLFLLLFSGLYMFVLPYAGKRRGGRGVAQN
jgi:hypothetical protein